MDLVTSLRQAGVARGDFVGLVISPALGLGLATAERAWAVAPGPGAQSAAALAAEVVRADEALRPRWAVWSGQTAAHLVAGGARLATCWDIAAAHRLLFGGWRADPGRAWAWVSGLDTQTLPADGPLDLFGMTGPDDGDDDDPVAPAWAPAARVGQWRMVGSPRPPGQVGGRPGRWPGSSRRRSPRCPAG